MSPNQRREAFRIRAPWQLQSGFEPSPTRSHDPFTDARAFWHLSNSPNRTAYGQRLVLPIQSTPFARLLHACSKLSCCSAANYLMCVLIERGLRVDDSIHDSCRWFLSSISVSFANIRACWRYTLRCFSICLLLSVGQYKEHTPLNSRGWLQIGVPKSDLGHHSPFPASMPTPLRAIYSTGE